MNYLKKFLAPESYLQALFSSALLVGFSFPFAIYSEPVLPFFISGLLAWVGWVPLLTYGKNLAPKKAWGLFYLSCFFASIISLFWIIVAMKKYGAMSLWESSGVLVALSLMVALFPATSAWLSGKLKNRVPFLVSYPIFMASSQLLLGVWPMGGFPWLSPAYSLFPFATLLQHLDIVGIYGYDIFLIAFNALVAQIVLEHSFLKKHAIPIVAILGFFYISALAKKWMRETSFSQLPTLRVGYVQGNIPQDEKHSAKYRQKIFEKYSNMTQEIASSNPKLIIWPEASLPAVLESGVSELHLKLGHETTGGYLLFGAPTIDRSTPKFKYLNSAFVVDTHGKILFQMDKSHLVPFGEYVPFSEIIPMTKIVPSSAGDFSQGAEVKPFSIPELNVTLGNLICYEILFPQLARTMVQKGANLLTTITNDAWFDQTSGPYQHFHFLRFRAIETRRAVVRSANTGFSGWVSPSGAIKQQSELFKPSTGVFDVPLNEEKTLYVRFPWLLPMLSWIFLITCILRRYVNPHGKKGSH